MHRISQKIGLTLLGIFLTASVHAADVYTIDPGHSAVEFAVSHMMVSETKGTFNDVAGTIEYDPQNTENTKIDVTIQTKSVNTRLEARDEHLRKPEFFDVEKYPTITFKNTALTQKDGALALEGDLTIKEVTKKVSIPLKITGPVKNGDKMLLGLSGDLTVNRQDFGVTWNKQMDSGGWAVGNEVKISFNVEAKGQ